MTRGIETFTLNEFMVLQALPAVFSTPSPLLAEKLTQSPPAMDTALELSRDDVELLLDTLPAPQESTLEQQALRQKLSSFLLKLG